MHTITGQTDIISGLSNIDYDLYVNNVLALLTEDMAHKVACSNEALQILDNNYLPFEAGTSEYRGVAELIIVFFNEVK